MFASDKKIVTLAKVITALFKTEGTIYGLSYSRAIKAAKFN